MEIAMSKLVYPPEEKSTLERLEIFTLGRFRVRFGRQDLFAETKGSHKIGQLFMYFITHRNKPAPPEAILEALWPEQDYSNPKNAVKIMVHRLKQKLDVRGVSDARFFINCSYGCYGWNHDTAYWLDADAFERLSQEARALVNTDPVLAADKYREALTLYGGDYLPECFYNDWVLPLRHYYRRLFVRNVSELLELQRENNLYSQVLEDCEKALFFDPFDEDLHLRYIEALLEEGKTNRARAHYEHITSLIYQELGAKPSPAMRRIYRSIMKKQENHPGLNIHDLQEIIKEQHRIPGALCCDPDEFLLLCKLESRRAERNKKSLYLGFLTPTGPDYQPPATEQLQVTMEQLKKVILDCLRRGDAFTPWNEGQYAMLLPGLSLDQAESVLQRIQAAFKKNHSNPGVLIRSGVHPVQCPKGLS